MLGVGEVQILTLLLISCVILGLSLYLSEALLPHLSYGWVSDSVPSEGLEILTTSTVFSKTKMHTHDLPKPYVLDPPTYLFENPPKKHKNENSEWP